jgi:competence protein ComEC
MEIVGNEKISRPPYLDLPRQYEINGVGLTIFYPPTDFSERRKKDHWRRKANNNSLVFKAALGDISFLFTGDIMAKAEKELVEDAGRKLKSTVLLLPHHGSQTSNTPQFIDAVQPHIGVISSGWKNRFKFPHLSVLNRYRQRGISLFRTDHHGAITLITDGEHLKVTSYLPHNG